ncbi:MAG: amino acid adenylation domain-containing protein [Candidatus Aminicenantes bacterium]|nr:MAG: amino acid adenylation domain-containing protein [Candidatus Aminicenantes bacterium]
MKNTSAFSGFKTAAGAKFIRERDYWLKKLSGHLEKNTIPYDHKRSLNQRSMEIVTTRFPREIFVKLLKLSNDSDLRLYIILVTALVIFIHKYTYNSNNDIIVGGPVIKQDIEGDYINTVLTLRNQLKENITFKELLFQVRQTIAEANENQNYPVESILGKLNIPFSRDDDFSLFDIAILLENIHYKKYLRHINLNMIFSFCKTDEYIEGEVEYNSLLYDKTTIEQILQYYIRLMQVVLLDVNLKINEIELLSEEERRELAMGFNDTRAANGEPKTLHRLFAEQAEKTPNSIAVLEAWSGSSMTYREIDQNVNHLAQTLTENGVKPDIVVGVILWRSLEMIIGILAVLKAGGAYLPIDPAYPAERIKYMLADSKASLLVTTRTLAEECETVRKLESNSNIKMIFIRLPGDFDFSSSTFPGFPPSQSSSLAYIIYTSGSTGKPKGVAIEHRSIVNTLVWRKNRYRFNEDDGVLQLPSISFDSSVEDIFTPLISGSRLILIRGQHRFDINYLKELLKTAGVTHFLIVPTLYRTYIEEIPDSLRQLKQVTIAGEQFSEDLVKSHYDKLNHVKLYNEYGPTENSVCSTLYEFSPDKTRVLIGTPIRGVICCILGKNKNLCPIGAAGEIYLAGAGIARGYLNQPELTSEKFDQDLWDDQDSLDKKFLRGGPGAPRRGEPKMAKCFAPYAMRYAPCAMLSPPGCRRQKIYKTGDLARRLPDKNIEFLGRIDQQVKISGYRIELGEIEGHLFKHPGVKETVVLVIEDKAGNKQLCAYIVPNAEGSSSLPQEIKAYLTQLLPGYMVPANIVSLESIPLTPNGKVDRNALPQPEAISDADYIAPRDENESRLAQIWSEVLGMETQAIGIDSNFFELGGNSLNAAVLTARVHQAFNIKITLVELFNTPTIRGLAEWMTASGKKTDTYTSIPAQEKKEYYQVSHAQERIWVLSQLEAASISFNIPGAHLVEGQLNIPVVERTFKTLMERHESLRTAFLNVDGEVKQRVVPLETMDFAVKHMDLRGEPGNEVKAREYVERESLTPFDLSTGPLVRITLIRLEAQRYVLFFNFHHIISDFLSHDILIREMRVLHEAFDKGEQNPLEPLPIQYRDYAAWQNEQLKGEPLNQHRQYWTERLKGHLPQLELPWDNQRPAIQTYNGDTMISSIQEVIFKKLKSYSETQNLTLFMVLLTALNLLFFYYTGKRDIVLGTIVGSRDHADLRSQIGYYLNTLVLRTQFQTRDTFKSLSYKVKDVLMGAYQHQVYPFDLLLEDIGGQRDISRAPIFDVLVNMLNYQAAEAPSLPGSGGIVIKYFNIHAKTAKFDLTIYLVEQKNTMDIRFEYNRDLFKPATIERMMKRFTKLLETVLEKPDTVISTLRLRQTTQAPLIQPLDTQNQC